MLGYLYRMENLCWGVDLGGTKIEGAVVDAPKGKDVKILERLRLPTEASLGYDHILRQIQKLLALLSEKTGHRIGQLGIGTPGIIDNRTKLIKNSNTLALIGRPMQADLERLLGVPVRMANDANCFALAETHHGIVPELSKNPEVVFGIIMGTGVGSGIVVNGRVVNGMHGIGGEWGHNVLEASGEACYCGKRGCVETFISGPALERYFQKIGGEKLPMPEIYRRFEQGERLAVQTVNRLVHYFGMAVGTIMNIIDPEIIVLGGGLGNLDILYSQGREEVKKYMFNYELNTPFVKPKLGDSAGVIGAALLWS